jgi:hypothetical protein
VAYLLIDSGRPLHALVKQLKALNARYRRAMLGWKTLQTPSDNVRESRAKELKRFLETHKDLIACFKFFPAWGANGVGRLGIGYGMCAASLIV